MNLAIIETGGKQYMVKQGDVLHVEKLKVDEGKTLTFDKVLGKFGDKDYELGKPFIDGATVTAKVLSHGRDKKIRVLKYKSKSRYRKVIGHRQNYTQIEITAI